MLFVARRGEAEAAAGSVSWRGRRRRAAARAYVSSGSNGTARAGGADAARVVVAALDRELGEGRHRPRAERNRRVRVNRRGEPLIRAVDVTGERVGNWRVRETISGDVSGRSAAHDSRAAG